jgi:hypothetical protein
MAGADDDEEYDRIAVAHDGEHVMLELPTLRTWLTGEEALGLADVLRDMAAHLIASTAGGVGAGRRRS